MDLDKIELSTQAQEVKKDVNVPKKGLMKKRWVIPGIFIIFLLWIVLGIVVPGLVVYANAKKTYSKATAAYEAAKKQNIILASDELKETREEVVKTQNSLKLLSYLRFIPILGWYYSDVEYLTNVALYTVEAAQITVDSIVPYADVLGLKGQGSFVLGSAEDRITKAVETLDKVTPRISDIEAKIKLARREVDAINPARYPNIGQRFPIKSRLVGLKNIVDQTDNFITEAKPLIEVMPALLGSGGEKKYLVLFQNDKELRATGGFITAYAIFRIDKGIIHVDRSDDIYNLDNSVRGKEKAPDPIRKYLPKVTTFNLRDSNLSPDFVESMKTFSSMYDRAGGKVKIDGIIALDTHMLVSTIKILDDKVDAAGINFTTKIDPRCDCPQVIYVLEDTISRPVGFQKAGRKDIIGELLYAIMKKSLSSAPRVYWGPLFQTAITQIGEKHILFYLYDEQAQRGIDALSASGRIKSFEGDYLHINDTNFGGQKSNMYTKHSVRQNIGVSDDGSITKTLTLEYKNPVPPSDCSLERGGLCLNAELRNWLRIYVPRGSELIESQGSTVEVTTTEDLGKTVFEGFLLVRPEGKATFTIKYKLPIKKDKKDLPLLIQKQSGTEGHDYVIQVNGKKVEEFQLRTDRELKIRL